MRHPSIKALHAYWERLSAGRPAPSRGEIDLTNIAGQLSDLVILEGGSGEFRIRYAGSRVVEAIGGNLTGTPFADLWSHDAQGRIRRALAAAADAVPALVGFTSEDNPAGAISPPAKSGLSSRAIQWPDRRMVERHVHPGRRLTPSLGGEAILLPLVHHGRIGGRILGALALFRHPATPRETCARLEISGLRFLDRASQPRRGTGLIPGEAAQDIVARRGHLVVMQGFRDRP